MQNIYLYTRIYLYICMRKHMYMHVHCEGSSNSNNNNGRQQEGVRKEEIQQWGTNTLMRSVKKTQNFILWEKAFIVWKKYLNVLHLLIFSICYRVWCSLNIVPLFVIWLLSIMYLYGYNNVSRHCDHNFIANLNVS